MEYKDYYRVLGVSKKASEKEIKQVYRKLARKYHPDVNPGDRGAEARFKEINEAYEVLSDKDKRRKYDQLGANWRHYERMAREQPGGFGGFPGFEGFRVEFGGPGPGGVGGGFSDFFKTFFGGGLDVDELFGRGTGGGRRGAGFGAQERPRGGFGFASAKGQDVSAPLEITLEESSQGVRKRLTIQRSPGAAPEQLEVKIPAGVQDGSRLRVAGKGEPGLNQGPRGDLFLEIKIRPHRLFRREGDNLYVDVPITVVEAALGAEIEVPTLSGKARIKVPPGSQSGRTLRLRGKGVPRLKGAGNGDLHVRLQVVTPTSLTKRERELLKELSGLSAENPRAHLGCA
ncbi:MAG: DnaJ C-terminal domain-containing protein [Acidobacteriota bacterium]